MLALLDRGCGTSRAVQHSRERVIKNVFELLAILPVIALLVWIIQAEVDFLLYPVAILSTLGVLVMLVLVNAMVATIVLRREGYALTWRQALAPITVGAALAILQMTGMVLLRAYLTARFGLPL